MGLLCDSIAWMARGKMDSNIWNSVLKMIGTMGIANTTLENLTCMLQESVELTNKLLHFLLAVENC